MRLFLILSFLTLTACGAAPGAVEVPPPVVITVVVTSTGSGPTGNQTETDSASTLAASATSAAGNPTEVDTPQYPAPFQNTVDAVYQDFERGFMIYLADRKAIWVFVKAIPDSAGTPIPTQNFGLWLAFGDTFVDGEPETDPAFVPPANYQQPKRGFGKVWRENAAVRDALGWGLDFERPYSATVMDYSLGTFDPGGVYQPGSFLHTVTTANGVTLHIDEATRSWSRP